MEKMRKAKRGNDVTGSFPKNKKTCNTEPMVSGHLHENQNEDVWSGLSDEQISCFSKSVASITLCTVHRDLNQEQLDLDSMGYPKLPSTMSDGEKRFFACTGFFIEWNGSMVILTSASLVRNSVDENKIVENLRIEVLLPHNQCRKGKLQDYCLHYNIALVSVIDYHARRPANGLLRWKSTGEVAAVGRCFKSGALMATTGNLVPWSGTLDCKDLIHSSCKITKVE
nr:unnamed protein product [Digitaria exilis]